MNLRENRFFKKDWMLFVIGGFLNTSFTYIIYLLLKLIVDYQLAFIFAFIVGIFFSYVFNAVIVFNADFNWKGLITYPLVYIVQFFISFLFFEILIRIIQINIDFAPLIVTALTLPITYAISKILLTRQFFENKNLSAKNFTAVYVQRKIRKIVSCLKSNFRIHRFLRLLRPYSAARPIWKKIVKSQSFPASKINDLKILVASSTGSHWAMSGFESVLGAALRMRGSSVEVLLCDGILPACQECDVRLFPDNRLVSEGVSPICSTCFTPAEKMFSELGLVVRRYSEFINESQRQTLDSLVETIADKDLEKYVWCGISIGEHAIAGALRFFGRGTLSGEKFGLSIARQYFRAALYTAAVMEKMLSQSKYEVVVFHHGIYVPQGVIGDVCRKYGVRVVNWNPAYKDRSFIFSHGDSYHKTMIDESVEDCINFEWNSDKDTALMEYLSSRRNGSNDWISFQKQSNDESTDLLKQLNIDINQPIVGLLTNVLWDAQLHFKANAFSSMLEWIIFTIDYFSRRSDIQLLIRIHPAELLGTVPSRQFVLDEINMRWPILPKNIYIVAPDDPKNTYALMNACDSVLVYGTKMSIELPCWGIPVVVAGEAWVRGKGFTSDVNSVVEYQEILSSLPKKQRMQYSVIEKARKYAYYLFFRRMIPVKFAKKNRFLVPFSYNTKSLDELAVNEDVGLDVICNGIIFGIPFLVD